MAVPDPDVAGDPVADAFLEQSYLTYIIPFATEFNPEDALRSGTGSIESKIAGIEQREQLFFGTRFAPCARCRVPRRSFAACR
jgi:hypothetical protein